MPKSAAEDKRLARLTELALALPEAERQIYGSHAQFLVRKKTFAYFLDNHHGDGIVAVTCKVLPHGFYHPFSLVVWAAMFLFTLLPQVPVSPISPQ
jgi:hypothetical protein